MDSKNKILISFFFIYFVITMFQVFFLHYIPLYYLDILKVDSSKLALVQIFPYLPLIISPLFGYLYDRYIKKESQSKLLYCISCLILCGSIFIFVLYKESLILFGIFTFLSLLSIYLIRTVMASLYLHLTKEIPDFKHDLILTLRITTFIAYITVSILFQVILSKISSLSLWHTFFLIGFFIMAISIIVSIVLNIKTQLFYKSNNIEISPMPSNPQKNKNYIMIFIYIAFFLASSDLLFLYLFSSWIFNKFGEGSFRFYSSLLLVFPIGQLLGNLIAYRLNSKNYDAKKLMFISIIVYMILLFSLTISDFLMILILNFGLSFVSSLAIFSYTSYVTDLSKNEKYKTCRFQILQTYSSLASIIFIPLSYALYSFVVIEVLILTSVLLFGFSGLFLVIAHHLDRKRVV